MQTSDWNAVSFGNDCIIGGFLQFHTLENMMLKVKRTDIQDGSAVNFGATVMGGAVIEPETTLLPLSMVLKEMHLPTGTYWGSPTEPLSGVQHASPFITQPQPSSGYSKMSGEAANNAESRPTRLTVPDEQRR
jgi:carbonic anhydrase/acetyltransferase-like protein (isoleucine patch superfamily)